jgi:hypothetical protein
VAATRIEFFLYRHADTAWREVIRPWLEASHGRLQRSYVVVPTRGQAHALKQRCLLETLPLLGVEFLSPGLARKKWLALGAASVCGHKPALGRELLLLGLGAIVDRRLRALAPADRTRGQLQSLQSDLERALDDFDELLRAGFGTDDFAPPVLREIFGELTAWVDALGYDFAPRQVETAAAALADAAAPMIGGRVLVHGFGPEMRGEFFNVAAFVRGFAEITVLSPEPDLGAGKLADTQWLERWEKLLGLPPEPLIETPPLASQESVLAGWLGGGASAASGNERCARAEVVIGLTRGDEMRLVADEIARALDAGAAAVAVIFPRADAAHCELVRLLGARGVPFVDQVGASGPPPIEVRCARALLDFFARGARLEELLALWPLLKALGLTALPLGEARDVCERLFDEKQTHELNAYTDLLVGNERAAWREVARVAARLLPPWPEQLTLAGALARFAEVWEKFDQSPLEEWSALSVFAERDTQMLPLKIALAALRTFLPAKSPALAVAGSAGFARVVLTTRRRAEGAVWSHLFLVESNAGVWPERRESSCWLTDEQRAALNRRAQPGLGLFTSEERCWFEKQGVATLVRDTTTRVFFSAALFDERDTELKLAPNGCLERILWAEALAGAAGENPETVFERRARVVLESDVSVSENAALRRWKEIYRGRREATRPFDEFFFAADPQKVRLEKLPARLIERGLADPAELWFEAVLGARRVGWAPFVRLRKKALGQLAHRLLAAVWRTPRVAGVFGEMPTAEEAHAKLQEEIAKLGAARPADVYWDSFHAELASICATLLDKVLALEAGPFVAAEVSLPPGATIPLDGAAFAEAPRFPVFGRIDLVRLDRPEWSGARVDVIDFKTGSDAPLTATRMARGVSLQLGIYLEALRSVGATEGRVHLLKPAAEDGGSLAMCELPDALHALGQLKWHLETGVFGARTPEPSEFGAAGFAWPLACTPIARKILEEKFAGTYGGLAERAEASDGDV